MKNAFKQAVFFSGSKKCIINEKTNKCIIHVNYSTRYTFITIDGDVNWIIINKCSDCTHDFNY